MQSHILEEWRVRDIEQKANRCEQRLYELDSLRRDVDSLEHSNREIRADIIRLCDTVETCLHQIAFLEGEVRRLTENEDA